MNVTLIVARAQNGAIGQNNQLLWHLPDDLKRFKRLTTGQVVVMGRKTYESIGKPLPNRVNVVITRNPTFQAAGCQVVSSVDEALTFAASQHPELGVFVIGGAEIYQQALPQVTCIELTDVQATPDADTFFSFDQTAWQEVFRENHPADERHAYPFAFVTLKRR